VDKYLLPVAALQIDDGCPDESISGPLSLASPIRNDD